MVTTAATGQNLVVNPSFETTATDCGQFGGEGFRQDLSASWDNANSNIPGDSCSSPDLFSACNTIFGSPGPTHMPYSTLGYQYARTGTRHAGIIVHEALDEYREYIQGRTSSPLVAGQTYCVSMYVSLGNSVMYATDNIGIRFNNNAFYRDPCPGTTNSRINQTPQLNYDCGPITDTTDWVRLQWNYTAAGGEQYFIIGNFFNNANTTIVSNPGGTFTNPYAYYYIDDVSIVPSSCCTADLTQPEPVCVTDPAFDLTAIAGNVVSCTNDASGTWSGPGITNAANGTFSPAAAGAGTHTVTFTMTCGFVATTTVVVNPCAALNVCVETNGGLTVSGGTGPYTWQQQVTTQDCSACQNIFPIPPCTFPPGCAVNVLSWSNFATTQTISAPAAYPIQVLDNAGGSLLLSSGAGLPACNVACNLSASVSAQQQVSCHGGNDGSATIAVTGATGTTSYTWTPGNLSGASQMGLAAGTYTVTASSDGCTASTTVTISEPISLPNATINEVVQPGCNQSNGSITVQVSGGTAGYTYSWAPSGGNQATASGLAAGSYTCTITDANGCGTTFTQALNNPNAPAAQVNQSTDVSCAGDTDGTATVSATGGSGGYTYLWDNNQTSATATGLAPGDHTCTVTDQAGCAVSVSITIDEPTALTATTTDASTPCGQNAGSVTATANGGTGPYSYAWDTAPAQNTATATGLGGGLYTVTVTDANGCSTTATATVTNTGGPTVNVTSVQNASCFGSTGSATLAASGGGSPYTYEWGTQPAQTGPTLTAHAGTYSYTVTNNLGCVTAGEVTITEPAALWPNATADDVTCKGDEDGSLNAAPSGGTPPYTYSWSNGPTTASQNSVTMGTYTVTVTDANGCQHDSTLSVSFQFDFSISITVNGNTFTSTGGGINYVWYLDGNPIPGANGPNYTMTQSGNYYVYATDANGCEGTSNIIEANYIGIAESVMGHVAYLYDAEGVVIRSSVPTKQAVQWQLLDASGRRIMEGTLPKGQTDLRIAMSWLASGAYSLNVRTEGASEALKVMWVR